MNLYFNFPHVLIYLVLIFNVSVSFVLINPAAKFESSFSTSMKISATLIHMPPADLTPAVDKFARLPTGTEKKASTFMTAKGPEPTGPEPFNFVAKELEPLSNYVKDLVASENPILTMAASHFFEKVTIITDT